MIFTITFNNLEKIKICHFIKSKLGKKKNLSKFRLKITTINFVKQY